MSTGTASTTELVDHDIEAIDSDPKDVQTQTDSTDASCLINIGVAASISRTLASTLFLLASCLFPVNLEATSNLFAGGMIIFLLSHAMELFHFQRHAYTSFKKITVMRMMGIILGMIGIILLVLANCIGFQSASGGDAISWLVGSLILLMGQLLESYNGFTGGERVHYAKRIAWVFAIAGTSFWVLGALVSLGSGDYYYSSENEMDVPEGIADSIKAMMEKSILGRAAMFVTGAVLYLLHSWFYLYAMVCA